MLPLGKAKTCLVGVWKALLTLEPGVVGGPDNRGGSLDPGDTVKSQITLAWH